MCVFWGKASAAGQKSGRAPSSWQILFNQSRKDVFAPLHAPKRPPAQRVPAEDSGGRLRGEHPSRPSHGPWEDLDRVAGRKAQAGKVPEGQGGRPSPYQAARPPALQLVQGDPVPPVEGHRAPDRREPPGRAKLSLEEVAVRLRHPPDREE